MESDPGRISIVDDDESIRRATRALLRSVGYQVQVFASAELFLEAGAVRNTDCLILDIRMTGMDGLELQRHLNAAKIHIPIIFVTAHNDATYRSTALNAGAVSFFQKPFQPNAFVAAIHAVLRNRAASDAHRGYTARGAGEG